MLLHPIIFPSSSRICSPGIYTIRGFLEWSFGAGCQGVDSFAAKYDLQVSTVERLIRGDRFTPEEAREVNMKIYDKLVDNLFSCRLDS